MKKVGIKKKLNPKERKAILYVSVLVCVTGFGVIFLHDIIRMIFATYFNTIEGLFWFTLVSAAICVIAVTIILRIILKI